MIIQKHLQYLQELHNRTFRPSTITNETKKLTHNDRFHTANTHTSRWLVDWLGPNGTFNTYTLFSGLPKLQFGSKVTYLQKKFKKGIIHCGI